MLGAVAAFLSILVARLEHIGDECEPCGRPTPTPSSPSGTLAASFSRRMVLLNRAIYFAVLSAPATAALLICAFVAALAQIGYARFVGVMFAVALALLVTRSSS